MTDLDVRDDAPAADPAAVLDLLITLIVIGGDILAESELEASA